LGEVYMHEKKLDLAEDVEKRAIALDPGRGEFHAALSEVYSQENRDDLASEECVAALQRNVPKDLEKTLKYNLACFDARLGRERECLFWLRQALEAGFNDIEFMRKDPDLATVRDLPAFKELFEQQ
jgi:tetratricopeptide (TPR) repeat protein